MKVYTCVVVDDEELARELLEAHLSQLDNFKLIASCASAIEASKVLKSHTVDLLFLDIEMPVLKGTDFYKNLLEKPKVIFTTAYRDYALDGFDLDAVDYLLKPIVFARFFKAIEKFLSLIENNVSGTIENTGNKDKHIFVRNERKQVKIVLKDILYVQSLKDFIQIHLAAETFIVKQTISSFEKALDNNFLRVHRSYIINQSRITAFTKNDIEIGGIEIPIGENYKLGIRKLFTAKP